MASIQQKIFNEMVLKLGMNHNDRLISKAIEILELIKAKSSEILKHMNENAKVILCLDISCELLNYPFAETSLAIQQSCLKKSIYNKNKKILQKVLDLNKKLTIDEVIRKLSITHTNNVEKLAKEIFKDYMKQQTYEDQDINPAVFVMSVYFACKYENVKVLKKNVLNLSNLTHSQWGTMEKSWEKWTSSFNKKAKGSTKKESEAVKENVPESIEDVQEPVHTRRHEAEETYDEWAKRILDKAYQELRTNK
ncbi:origin recognition complex subunit 6 [Chironomus tepperi]|uniref:origin recognition complex subunit 6 n=1 Tax=Chironomus tepperi TaxID=113505 RepID=UPI00391F5CD1